MLEIEHWQALDLQERRYITIVSDGEFREIEAKKAADSGSSPSFPKIPKAALFAAPLAAPFLIALPAVAAAVGAGYLLHKAGQAADEPPVMRIPASLAAGVDFGAQGWEPGVVYAANPKHSGVYRPLARFHEELLVHKLTELDRLLNALGAKEYMIRHIRTRDRKGAAELGVGGLAEIRGGTMSGALCERIWSGTSDGHEPSLPEGLVWYPSEREWQNLVDSRFRGTRRQFGFSVRQDESFGVDAELALRFEALNFKIGGRYASVEHVQFGVSGTF